MNNFNNIIGHEYLIKNIKNSIRTNKISHAYIIDGEKGIGKKLLVNAFAKTLQCKDAGDEPCNLCDSCKSFDIFNHPDIKYIRPTKKASLGVDDIREQLNMDIYVKPYHYPYKIYIIEEGDLLTEQAQNALLKTIEEPPRYAIIFIIVNNSSKLLETVLSRCVLLSLKNIGEDKIVKYLMEEENISHAEARVYASISKGNIGKAKTFLNSTEFGDIRNDIIDAVDFIIKEDDMGMMEVAKKINEYKEKAEMTLELLVTWLKDLMLLKKINDENYIINKDKYEILLNQAQELSYNRIDDLLNTIQEIQSNFKVNVNYQLSMEILFFGSKK